MKTNLPHAARGEWGEAWLGMVGHRPVKNGNDLPGFIFTFLQEML